jgi:hypothetical protein
MRGTFYIHCTYCYICIFCQSVLFVEIAIDLPQVTVTDKRLSYCLNITNGYRLGVIVINATVNNILVIDKRLSVTVTCGRSMAISTNKTDWQNIQM